MATFLTTKSTAAGIERLIRTAERRVVLVTPYIQISTEFLTRLQAADKRGVEVVLVYGKDTLKEEEKTKLRTLKKLSLRYLHDLHAKCYANERELIVSTMNFYEYSEKNREMGILLTGQDAEAMREARAEIEEILDLATKQPLGRGSAAAVTRTPTAFGRARQGGNGRGSSAQQGYCIRCRTNIRYNPHGPLCEYCYDMWAMWENVDYPEQGCHRCGEDAEVSKARPLCYDCFCEAPFSTGL